MVSHRGWRAVGKEMLVPSTVRSFRLPCVCGQSNTCCVHILGDMGLLRSHLFQEAPAEGLMWMEGRGEKDTGHQRRTGLGGSAAAFDHAHAVRLSQSLLL